MRHGMIARWCPDSEARNTLQQALMRTSESNRDASRFMILVWLPDLKFLSEFAAQA